MSRTYRLSHSGSRKRLSYVYHPKKLAKGALDQRRAFAARLAT
jgi:hypothetical protein